MNKILVEIFVPAADKRFDVYIPPESRISEILLLTSKLLSELSDGKYKATDETVLCDEKSGKVLDVNMTAFELEIKNGLGLMLI